MVLGVMVVALPCEPRDYAKALIERLNDDQVQALLVILESMAWPTERVTPVEVKEIEAGFAEIDAGKGVKAEDVWKELGI
jgi:hypothetical protein